MNYQKILTKIINYLDKEYDFNYNINKITFENEIINVDIECGIKAEFESFEFNENGKLTNKYDDEI